MNFSVIVCTYNYARFLPHALRTLQAQTINDFEVLIVDDGSTDNTKEVVSEWSGLFRNCIYLKKPHSGLADSRNFGVRHASGTHIAFLDADDFWSPIYLESVVRVFDTTPEAELVCCDGLRVDDLGTVHGAIFPTGLPAVRGKISSGRELFSFLIHTYPSTTVSLKSLYERVGFYDDRFPISNDQHWVLRVILSDACCVRLDRKLVLYRSHGSNLSAHLDQMFESWLQMYAEMPWHLPESRAYARRFTRNWLPGLLARYPAPVNRRLLGRAMDTIGGDPLLRIGSLMTYFGLCRALRWTLAARRHLRSRRTSRFRIDLNAPPKKLFERVF
jgi:glycosyltransferase involved in cell wall biosynthesis